MHKLPYIIIVNRLQEMIDLVQWRSVIGCFILKFRCYIGYCKYANTICCEEVLCAIWNHHFGISGLRTSVFIIYVYVVSMLLLCCGDIEMNPGPVC